MPASRKSKTRRLFQATACFPIATALIAFLLTGLFPGQKSAAAQTNPNAQLAQATALVQQGKLDEAEAVLQKILANSPHSARAANLLGTVYLRQGKFTDAEKTLVRAIASSPGLLDPRINLGDAYAAAGKLELAAKAYEDAVKIAPNDIRANVALAKLYLGSGEFEKSIKAASNIPAEKRTTELLPTLAADYFGLRQPDKAQLEVQGMLEVAAKEADLVPELAEFFLAHGDFKSALELLGLARSKQPNTDRFLVDFARAHAGLGQLDEAQKSLESVLEHAPDSVDALLAAGDVAGKQSDWPSAAEAFTRAASVAPDRPDVLYGLASAQLYANKPEAALGPAQKLHALLPDDLRAKYVLALALFGLKRGPEAKPYVEQVLAAHPDDREMNLVLVDIAFNDERNLPLARKHADICLKQNPADPGALYYLGTIQRLDGDIKSAIESLTKSVAGNPRNGDAQGILGTLLLQVGDVAGARRVLEQAVQLVPKEAQNHYQLALTYTRLGETALAKQQLEIYQEMKAKEAKDAKQPATSDVPSAGVSTKP